MLREVAPWLEGFSRDQLLIMAQSPTSPPEDLEALARAFPDDEELVRALLSNPSIPPSALVALARGASSHLERLVEDPNVHQTKEAVEALLENPNLTPELKRRLFAQAPPRKAEERRKSLIQVIRELTTGQKIALAKKGNKEARMILIKDPNELIALEVVSSPRITEAEILSIAQMRDVSEKVLRYIANDRQYRSNKQIVLSLLHNPKTPVGVSLNLGISSLSDTELERLAKDRNIPGALSRAARNILDQRKKPPPEPGH